MNALIFGARGQDGQYLTELLLSLRIEVIGITRSASNIFIDVSNYSFVESLIKRTKPDFIFHFAANSTTKHDALFENHLAISTGTLNILESVYKYSKATKVFISGSGLQFVNKGIPISEIDPFEARDPYCVARIQSVYAARYFRSLGLQVYVGYFFHHDSPLRSERHLNMRIAKAARRIKEGSGEYIQIGNLDVIKEFNYAGDFMNAIWMLINQDEYFEIVVGSGKGYRIKEWISICFDLVNLDWTKYVRIDDSFTPDFISLVCNPALLNSIGWTPQLDITDLAQKMMESK